MNINATFLGGIIALFALTIGVVCYYLGLRKTQVPVLAGLLGLALSIIPPFGLVYLVVLVLKNDIGSTTAPVSGYSG